MRATTREVAPPSAAQRDACTTSSPFHSPANTASLRCSSRGKDGARWSSAIGLAALHGLDDFLRGVVEIVRGQHVEAGFANNLLAGVDVGAFDSHDERHFQADLLDRGDHALGDDVALHDAAEDVD